MRSAVCPQVALEECGSDTGVLVIIRAFGLRGALLTLGSGSRDGDCNGPGETGVRTKV